MLFVLVPFIVLLGLSNAGNLVIIGGGTSESNAAWDEIIDLAGGADVARIGVISAASSDPPDSGSYYVDLFLQKGADEAVFIPIHEGNREANSDPEVIAEIQRMTGFFFSGGDQARIINSLYNDPGRNPSPAMVALKEAFDNGAVMSGSSAGAVCMGTTVMIMGGYSWESLQYGAYEWTDPNMPRYTVQYDKDGGIGMLNGFVLDSHVGERGREGRLTRLVLDTRAQPNGANYGIGLDEDTALVITKTGTPDITGRVVGSAGVVIVDVTRIHEDTHNGFPRLRDVIFHYLTIDDTVNLDTMDISFSEWKTPLEGRESLNRAPTSDYIFDGNYWNSNRCEFIHVATGLFNCRSDDSTWGDTYENSPNYRVDLFKVADVRAAGYEGRDPESNQNIISYQYLYTNMYATQ